jgi:GNAT superfamily N-acetyltransferase
MQDGAFISKLHRSKTETTRQYTQLPASGPLVDQIRVDHGPPALLGRFFLAADTFARERGLRLTFASFEEMAATHEAQKDNWPSLIPTFDCRVTEIPHDRAFCIAVRDGRDRIVGMCAERFYDLTGSTLAEAVASGVFMPIEPAGPDGVPTLCELSAPTGGKLTGRVHYSGAVWVHPEYRGMRLAGYLPRVTRSVALTTWDIAYNFGFVKTGEEASALVKRYGLPHAEREMRYRSYWQSYEGAIIWMDVPELLEDLGAYLRSIAPEVDVERIARRA